MTFVGCDLHTRMQQVAREKVTAVFKTVFGMPSAAVAVAVIKAAVILLVLIMISEVPNFGRTAIEPFASPTSDQGVIPIGRQISDRTLNTALSSTRF